MKKFLLLLVMAMPLLFVSCSKDSDNDINNGSDFDYPMEQLYGKWNAISVQVDGKWYDVTEYPYTKFGMSITFNKDGSYYGAGYFGNGSGTYKVKGKTITTYIDGQVYATYYVNSLSSSIAELTMEMGGDSLKMKAKKQ
ncbi:MAG: lipocalin family protein [Bacteroidaceae bacterium]|nr:lipocalin family protein [Bacteroidaceae bacterium]